MRIPSRLIFCFVFSLDFKFDVFLKYLIYLFCFFLQTGFKRLEDFPMTFWLALFVEGTRFTQEKLEAAQDYASSRGLPSPRNVLIPRTKVSFTKRLVLVVMTFTSLDLRGLQNQGFVSAVTQIRSFVPAIYDCTLSVQKNQPTPTLLRMFSGQSSEV